MKAAKQDISSNQLKNTK